MLPDPLLTFDLFEQFVQQGTQYLGKRSFSFFYIIIMITFNHVLFIIYYLLFIIYYLLFIIYYLLFIIYYHHFWNHVTHLIFTIEAATSRRPTNDAERKSIAAKKKSAENRLEALVAQLPVVRTLFVAIYLVNTF
jgi:hypothetical protein